ncbi:hypothetical protein [Oxalicibacterium faecigallinarum]|uniref:hypothetical protein n=1 Tax=Oxalicibacterium faecigallinarum TaxID=573741 RepID=UPI00166B2FA2|nr:hypothetical protein [Oxalicibacterium faecigallinarum]
MNSAPAELLHLLTYAALQPYMTRQIRVLSLCGRQKKRQRARRHWNSVSQKTNLFQTKKPPHLTESGEAACSADEILSVFYCSLKSVVAFPVLSRIGFHYLPVFCAA